MNNRKIFKYSTPEIQTLVEECMNKKKMEYGTPNGYLIERWILMGVEKEGTPEQSKKAREIIKEKYNL